MQSPVSNDPPDTDERSPAGIIDTIGLAFALLNRRPYLIWLPVLFDSLLWSGVRIGLRDPLSPLETVLRHVGESSGIVGRVRDSLVGIDLVAVLALLTPTLIRNLGRESVPFPAGLGTMTLNGAHELLFLALAMSGALLAGMTYLTIVGRLITDTPAWGWQFMTDCAVTAYKSVKFMFAVLGLFAFISFPLAVIAAGLWLIGVDPFVLVVLASILISLWLCLFFVFGIPAMALGERSIAHALRSSYQVVQQNFLAVTGLLLIMTLIRAGAPYALEIFTQSEWSVPFAIVVNAYIATGLLASVMLFYDRQISHANRSGNGSAVASSGY